MVRVGLGRSVHSRGGATQPAYSEEGFSHLTAYEPLIERCNIKEIIGYLAQT
jgi:hypothetical protein